MGASNNQNNSSTAAHMDPDRLARDARSFFATKQSSSPLASSKQRVLRFAEDNGINVDKSLIGPREFPKSAYADELEKYPVVKD